MIYTRIYLYVPSRLMTYLLVLVHTSMYKVCTKTSVLVQVVGIPVEWAARVAP
jgi:hypothetical protein